MSADAEDDRPECRIMFTRKCPLSGCTDLPCARFEDDDESRWIDPGPQPGAAS